MVLLPSLEPKCLRLHKSTILWNLSQRASTQAINNVRQGKVTLVNAPAPPQPPAPDPAPDPAPEPPEPTLEERLAAAEARREAARLERERKSRERLRFLGAAYGGRG